MLKARLLLIVLLAVLVVAHGNHGHKHNHNHKHSHGKEASHQHDHDHSHDHDHNHDHHDHGHDHSHNQKVFVTADQSHTSSLADSPYRAYLQGLVKFFDSVGSTTSALICTVSVSLASVLVFASIWIFSSAEGVKQSVLNILALFAVGTLLGDVLLHLMPSIEPGVESQLAIIAGILLFYVVDRLLSHSHHGKEKHSHDALLNVVADVLHNFLDGMAIASSFQISSFVGITTTFAIFIHEISHEVGDFVMLLRSGYSLRQAYFSNFITGLSALAGTCLTLYSSTTSLERYILPIVVGNFLYISLVTMLAGSRKTKGLGTLATEVFAYTLGASFMYLVILIE